ncbi:hypothetical protein J6TS1_02580 [Siminovitchia terrae]|uniref:DUF2178 domain-containing protein n=1 Tax=Siminovitchia terrae TaxID=1914933 RepID=A0ABQ4KQS0_SIMTE|nr:hypothetical protein J22TS1_11450 [Siminovitchia terrae]GIN94388.1 hypothetical protein J6TS1_02580 [Siminovitchia terrae]
MKIYSKKKFLSGIVSITMTIVSLSVLLIKGFDLKLSILTCILFIFSFVEIRNSISKEKVRNSHLEEIDERNQYVTQKSLSKSFHIMQIVCIGFVVMFIFLYAWMPNELLLGMLLTFAFMVFLSFIIVITTNIYYESRL